MIIIINEHLALLVIALYSVWMLPEVVQHGSPSWVLSCYWKCDPKTSSIGITWGPVRNPTSWDPQRYIESKSAF